MIRSMSRRRLWGSRPGPLLVLVSMTCWLVMGTLLLIPVLIWVLGLLLMLVRLLSDLRCLSLRRL